MLLLASSTAWAVGATAVFQLSVVLPSIRAETGMSLATAGVLVGVANGGLTVALLGWGVLADRFGERGTMSCGLALCGLLLLAAAGTRDPKTLLVLFGLIGAAAASVYAPSGLAVARGFPLRQRAFALGIAQTSTPIGSALAAAILPGLAVSRGLTGLWMWMAGICMAAAVFVGLLGRQQPHVPHEHENGSARADPRALRRTYAACALLILPQSTLLTFSVSYLVDDRAWSPVHAGQLLSVALLLTVITRPAVGRLADRVGCRVRLMRAFALGNAAVLLVVLVGALSNTWLGPAAVLVAATSTVTGFSLASTVVAGFAEEARLGRALGTQQTVQSLTGTIGPVVLSGVIGAAGYAAAFAAIALAPVAGAVFLPVRAENRRP
jgi:MFS family permease